MINRVSIFSSTAALVFFLACATPGFALPTRAKLEYTNGTAGTIIRIFPSTRRIIRPQLYASSDNEIRTKTTTASQTLLLGSSSAQVRVLAKNLRWGYTGCTDGNSQPIGCPVPVWVESKLQQDPDYQDRFGGVNVEEGDVENDVDLGSTTTTLTFRAVAAYDSDNADGDDDHLTGGWSRTVASDSLTAAIVGTNGQDLDSLLGDKGMLACSGPTPAPVCDILSDNEYIDPVTHVLKLDPNQILVMFELGSTDSDSPAYDFEDLVIVIDLDGNALPPDYYLPDLAVGSPDPDFDPAISLFNWSAVRAAPGDSRKRGVVYLKTFANNPSPSNLTEGYREIKTCIAGGAVPNWSTCNSAAVPKINYFTDVVGDLGITSSETHAIAWREFASNVVTYRLSFSRDDGVTWNTPIPLGSYPETGASPADIDVAVSDDQKIGILTFFQPGGSEPGSNKSLVFFMYNALDLNPTPVQQAKITITPLTSLQFSSGCTQNCFGLTGDIGSTFHAFFYENSGSNYNGKVWTTDGTNASFRTIHTNSGSALNIRAARALLGAKFAASGSTSPGIYDVPTAGAASRLTTTSPALGANTVPDGWEESNALRSTMVSNLSGDAGDRAQQVWNYQADASGGQVSPFYKVIGVAPIDQITQLPLPFCPTTPTNIGPKCYGYGVATGTSRGGVVSGNVYHTSTMLTIRVWSGSQYEASDEDPGQRIVIHRANSEP